MSSSNELRRMIELHPMQLSLELGTSEAPQALLTVKNLSVEHLVFKVKSNKFNRYLVKPNQDVIKPCRTLEITIQMAQEQWTSLLKSGPLDEKKDMFLVVCIPVGLHEMSEMQRAERDTREFQSWLSKFWESADKERHINRRIPCTLVFPNMPVANNPEAKEVWGPRPIAAANSNTPVMAATPNAPIKDAELSFESLKTQHKDTLALLVSVTEERDRYQAKCSDLTKELSQLKEDARTSKTSGGDSTVVGSSIQQWHLLLVAILSFLLARLVQISKPELMSF